MPRSRWITRAQLAALALAIAGAAGAQRAAQATPAAQSAGDATATYRLADTWAELPWRLTPGQVGLPADVTSAPDGSVFVLDGLHKAVHVFDPDGQARRVFVVDGVAGVARIDAGWDGTVSVLAYLDEGQVVRRFAADGRRLASLALPPADDWVFGDIAVAPDGRTYLLAHAFAPPAVGHVDVLDARGGLDDRIDLDFLQASGDCRRALVMDLEVAADETVYVSTSVNAGRCGPPGPIPTSTPGPSPQPPYDQPPFTEGSGLLVFDAAHRLLELIPADADDVAPGSDGPWVTAGDDVVSAADGRRRHTVARPREIGAGPVYADNGLASRLDVAAGDRVRVTRARCYTNAVVAFGDPAAPVGSPMRADRVISASDDPLLQGPTAPIRLAVGDATGDDLLVLEAATYRRGGLRRSGSHEGPAVVQRWSTTAGRPVGQTHLCAAAPATVDIAADGGDLYSIAADGVTYRPDDLPPRWILHLPDARLIAGDADAGRVAVLDAAGRRVRVVGRDGDGVASWSTDRAGGRALPADLALRGDRVYLADLGRNRIDVRDIGGAELGSWPTHDGPRRIAIGPDGHVFVLGRGGWGLEYAGDGTLLATWPLPDQAAAQDVAVDAGGRVYVSFLGLRAAAGAGDYRDAVVEQAGVWVFERGDGAGSPDLPAREGCLARPDKTAAPRRLPLGDRVDVTLTVAGQCPGWQAPHQLVVVLDTSVSMRWSQALDRAKAALLTLVGSLDLDNVRAGLVTFNFGAALEAPLSGDIGDLRARIARAAADGDALMGAGIDLARIELTGPRGNPAARRTILVVGDGIFKDEPAPAIAAARAAGIDVLALVYPTDELTPDAEARLAQRFGGAGQVLIDLPPTEINRLSGRLTTWQPIDGLFETITVVDTLPANMRYVPGSAAPPAAFDPAARRLAWALGPAAAGDGIALTYQVEPLQPGIWPTNVEATADYRDALGFAGRLLFPIPRVEVYPPPPATPTPTAIPPTATATPAPPDPDTIFLPFAVNRGCLPARVPLDVALVMDTSSSMSEPAAGGAGTKLDAAKAAARDFVDLLNMPADHVGVAAFDGEARTVAGLTGDRPATQAAIAGLDSRLGTRIDLGLAQAAGILGAGRRPGAVATVVLLTDGRHNGSDPATVAAAAEGLKAAGVIVYTIGLGSDIDAELLRRVATSPDRFLASPTTGDLVAIYRQVLVWLACDGQGAADRPGVDAAPAMTTRCLGDLIGIK